MRLDGKAALITGGAKRLGRAIALQLAEAGANIMLHYNTSEQEAQQTLVAIREFGVEAVGTQANLAEMPQAERIVDEAIAHYGRLDILINNAALFWRTPFGTVTEDQWDALLNTNLKAPFFCAQRAGTWMKENGGGVLINMIDTGVYIGWSGFIPYLASKAGLEQMTYGLAKTLAPTVRVNGIAPGPILAEEGLSQADKDRAIERSLLKRMGGEQSIAEAVLYLVTAEFVTGVVLPVDGGQRWK